MYDTQVSDTSSLKRVFQTNRGYSRVPFPMIHTDADKTKGVLNLKARFFWEDIPYGLMILRNVADLCGVQTPNIDKMIYFHQNMMPIKFLDEEKGMIIEENVKETGIPKRYGIDSLDQLVQMSRPQTKKDDISRL